MVPRTFEELCAWIKKNTRKEHRGGLDIKGCAFWFVAYQEAMGMRDNNSIKDWAHILLDGIPAIQGDEERVTTFLVDYLGESAVGDEEHANLIACLEAHFGL